MSRFVPIGRPKLSMDEDAQSAGAVERADPLTWQRECDHSNACAQVASTLLALPTDPLKWADYSAARPQGASTMRDLAIGEYD